MQNEVHRGGAESATAHSEWLPAMRDLGHTAESLTTSAVRLEGGHANRVDETIAEETPITLAYNGVAHAVMMATPSDLEDFAVGFSLTEGLVERADALVSVAVVRYSQGIELQIETVDQIDAGIRSRRLSGRTGCGICGKENVEQVLRELPRVTSDAVFSAGAISRAMQELSQQQPLNSATGAVHAAGFADGRGSIVLVREDVGRHNALDKLIGALARASVPAAGGFVALTSRGSFELVQKAAVLGVELLATVSAPTGLAIRMARDAGLTFCGFARDGRVTVYTHPERISPSTSDPT